MKKDLASKCRFACAVAIAGVAIPLSLIAGPTARAATASAGGTAASGPVSGSPVRAEISSPKIYKPTMTAASPADADGSSVTLTPASGAPGTTVTASGSDWTAGDGIQAEWADDDSNLGSPVVVAADGTFTDSFAIPTAATPSLPDSCETG
jgi:hypothetical protein